MKTQGILILFFLLVSISCKHEIKTQATPSVSFANDIQPIIISNCTMSSCHGSINTSKFTLLTYNDVIQNGEIKAKYPNQSSLYKKITTANKHNIMPPPPSQPLLQEQITLIKNWIKEGAKSN